MPPRRNIRTRQVEEVYGEDNPQPNQPNPEISEAVQQALNSMMPGLISQVVEAVRQASGTTTNNNVGGTGLTSTGTTTATLETPLTLHQWLEKFLKQKPQSFSSTTNPVEAEHWIKHLEKIFEILECPDNIQVRLAAYKLEGDANQWWQSWKQARGGNTFVENLMWSQFRDAFLQQYFTEADRESYIRDYANLKQHEGESVTDFAARFLRLVAFAGPLAGTETHQIKKFRWALQSQYRSKMMAQTFTGLSHIINTARDIELERIDFHATKGDSKKRSHNSSSGSQSGQTAIRPRYNFAGQRKQGSSRSSLSSGTASKTGNLAPPTQCKDCGKIHRPGPCLRMTGACYSCGQQGHMARDCKQSQSGRSGLNDKGKQTTTGGRVFALSAGQTTDGMVSATVHINDNDFYALFDTGATHSIVSEKFEKFLRPYKRPLNEFFTIATPSGYTEYVNDEYVDCPLLIGNKLWIATLLPMRMKDFDLILGMDWLAKHRVTIDCEAKKVIFGDVTEPEHVLQGIPP